MRHVSLVALALLGCAAGPRTAPPSTAVGPTTALPPVALDKQPFAKAEGARFFTEEQPGVARRPKFSGEADLAVEQQDLHLGPHKSYELKPNGATVGEVREGKGSVTIAGAATALAAGGVFTVGDGQAATIANAGDEPLALRLTSVRPR